MSNLFLSKYHELRQLFKIGEAWEHSLSQIHMLTEVDKWLGGDYILYKQRKTGAYVVYDVKNEETIYSLYSDLEFDSVSSDQQEKFRPITRQFEKNEQLSFKVLINNILSNDLIVQVGSNDLEALKEESEALTFIDKL